MAGMGNPKPYILIHSPEGQPYVVFTVVNGVLRKQYDTVNGALLYTFALHWILQQEYEPETAAYYQLIEMIVFNFRSPSGIIDVAIAPILTDFYERFRPFVHVDAVEGVVDSVVEGDHLDSVLPSDDVMEELGDVEVQAADLVSQPEGPISQETNTPPDNSDDDDDDDCSDDGYKPLVVDTDIEEGDDDDCNLQLMVVDDIEDTDMIAPPLKRS